MKKLVCRIFGRFGLVMGLTLMLFPSCREEGSTPYAGITLLASKESLTRATETQFVEGDQVGAFIVRYTDATTPGVLSAGNFVANKKFQCNAEGRFIPESTLDWYTVAQGESAKSDFYAYYPYNASLDLSNLSAVTFSVKTDQSTWNNHTASDFMWARVFDQTPEVGGVPMTFKHTMARFIINVKANSGSLDPAKLVVKFKNVRTTLTWNLNTMAADNRDSVSDITPYKLTTPAAGYDASYAVIIPPQVITSDLVQFVYDGGSPKTWKPFSSPATSYDICYGKQYSLNVGLTL